VKLQDEPFSEKLRKLAGFLDRDGEYVTRVLDVKNVATLRDLTMDEAVDVIKMLDDEDTLQQNEALQEETFEPDDTIPF